VHCADQEWQTPLSWSRKFITAVTQGQKWPLRTQFTLSALNSEQEEKHLCVSNHSVHSGTKDLVVD